MINAKMLSERIRMKRKKMASDGVENMVDTAPGPQMNPQDILFNKQTAQWSETMGLPEKKMAPSDPADEATAGTSQDTAALSRHMSRVKKLIGNMKIG
jgi:hypothetical protein